MNNPILDNHNALNKLKRQVGSQVSFHKPSEFIANHQLSKGVKKAFSECKSEILEKFKNKKRKYDGYIITQEGELDILLTEVLRYIERLPYKDMEVLSEEISKTDYLSVLCRLFGKRVK